MIKKLLVKTKKFLLYIKNPKYLIIKGLTNGDNRAIMILGARPVYPPYDNEKHILIHGYPDDTSYLKMSFENQPDLSWWKSSKYKTIWSFKELLYWRRLLPNNGYKCLEYKNGKWNKIK